jgi:hypothetical protein
VEAAATYVVGPSPVNELPAPSTRLHEFQRLAGLFVSQPRHGESMK